MQKKDRNTIQKKEKEDDKKKDEGDTEKVFGFSAKIGCACWARNSEN